MSAHEILGLKRTGKPNRVYECSCGEEITVHDMKDLLQLHKEHVEKPDKRLEIQKHYDNYVAAASKLRKAVHGCLNEDIHNPIKQLEAAERWGIPVEEIIRVVEMKRRDNASDKNRKKTHCKNGHEFTPENTRIGPERKGQTRRICRECQRQWAARKRAARKA